MLRRGLTVGAMSFALGIASSHLCNNLMSLIILAAFILAEAMLLFYLSYRCKIYTFIKEIVNKQDDSERILDFSRIKLILLMIITFFTIGVIMGYVEFTKASIYKDEIGKKMTLEGIISSINIRNDESCNIILKTDKREKILLNVSEYSDEILGYQGAKVRVKGILQLPPKAPFPGGFDYSLYLKSKGVLITMKIMECNIKVLEVATGFKKFSRNLIIMKDLYRRYLVGKMGERNAGILCGILFGDTGHMEDDILVSFRQNGIGHLLAASGLHVGFLYGLMVVLLRHPTGFLKNMPILFFMFIYVVLAGFSPSVVRAVMMVTIHIISQILYRPYDFLTSISFCFLILLIYRPSNLFASGFQLTFIAVFTIAIVVNRFSNSVSKYYGKKLIADEVEELSGAEMWQKKLLNGSITILGIQMGIAPISLYMFHYISPASLLLNPPAIVIAGFIVPIGIIILFLFMGMNLPILGVLASIAINFMAKMENMLITVLIWMNGNVENTVLSYKYVASPYLWFILIYYFSVFFFCSDFWKRIAGAVKKLDEKI